MATASSQLQLAFSVNLGGLETGMRQAASTVRSGASQIRGALDDAGGGAERAGHGFTGLADKLREYRREEVLQTRSTKFFTAELASILPVSQGVANALGRLGGALVGGVGVGLAFEGVKLIAEQVTENYREQKKAAEELAAAQAKLATELRGVASAWQETYVKALTSGLPQSEQQAMAQRRELLRKRADKKREIDAAEADLTRDEADITWGETASTLFGVLPDSGIEEKRRNIAKLRQEFDGLGEQIRKVSDSYAQFGTKADAVTKARADEKANAWLREDMRGQMPTAAPTPEMRPVWGGGTVPQAGAANDITNGLAIANVDVAVANAMAEKDRLLKEDEDRTEAYARNIERALAPMERGFSDVFSAAMTGSLGASEAMSKMGQSIVQSTVSMITQIASKKLSAHIAEMMMDKQKVAGNAATAASGAAASQASIPIVGPMLAMAAMAAMQFAVLGLTRLFSAAGGFDVPAGLAPITQLHPREMVLPAEHADTIRRLGREGGGASGPITFAPQVQAGLDPRSLKRALYENVDVFVDTYYEAQDRRLIP